MRPGRVSCTSALKLRTENRTTPKKQKIWLSGKFQAELMQQNKIKNNWREECELDEVKPENENITQL